MDSNLQSTPKKLVLVGGGHSHAIVLKMLAQKPLSGISLTLITPVVDTPYSGMLPGHIAGFYSHAECHINLQKLSNFAQAQLYINQAIRLDLKNNRVLCANQQAVDFDLLSINIGSTPTKASVSGAAEYAIGVKPVKEFLENWYKIQADVAANPQKTLSLAIIGGGVGGVELALSMQANLHHILQQHQQPKTNLEIHLFQRTRELLPNHPYQLRHLVKQILTDRGIKLHLDTTVTELLPVGDKIEINCQSGLTVNCDKVFCVTHASAPEWVKNSGIGTDAEGFILVDDNLQSITHSQVFAAGDIASMLNYHLPKAGIFAVRQGEPLYRNLRRAILGKPLKPYHPQKEYLSLIGTGDKRAIASRGNFTLPPHPLLWQWKDWIDKRFMAQFI